MKNNKVNYRTKNGIIVGYEFSKEFIYNFSYKVLIDQEIYNVDHYKSFDLLKIGDLIKIGFFINSSDNNISQKNIFSLETL